MRRGTHLAALVVGLVLMSVSPTIRAQNSSATARAEKHFLRAQKHFSLGQFDEALKQYEAAYDAKPFPDFLFNIAQCHRNLGDYEQAVKLYRQYLEEMPQAPNRQETEATIKKLEREIEKQRAHNPTLVEEPDAGSGDNTDDDEIDSPFYKRWPFWVGVAVVGAAGGATGVYFLTRDSAPTTDLGNLDF